MKETKDPMSQEAASPAAPPPPLSFVILNLCPDGAEIAGADVAASLAAIRDALEEQADAIDRVYGGGPYPIRVGANPTDRGPDEIGCNVRPTVQNLAPGALAFHQVVNGVPDVEIGIDECTTVTKGNGSLSQGLSHEIGETIVDAGANGWETSADGATQAAREACDMVQNTFYEASNGVSLSNWLYPNAWVPGAPGPWDYLGVMKAADDVSNGYVIEATSPTDVHDVAGGARVLSRTLRPGDGRAVRVRGTLDERQLRRKAHPWSRTSRRGAKLGEGVTLNESAARSYLRALPRELLAQEARNLETARREGLLEDETYARVRGFIEDEIVDRRAAVTAAARPPVVESLDRGAAPGTPPPAALQPTPGAPGGAGPSWTPAELAEMSRTDVLEHLSELERQLEAKTITVRGYSRARQIMQAELAKRPLTPLRAPRQAPATAAPPPARTASATPTRAATAPPALPATQAQNAPHPPVPQPARQAPAARNRQGASSPHGQQRQAQSAPSHRPQPPASVPVRPVQARRPQAPPPPPPPQQPIGRQQARTSPLGRGTPAPRSTSRVPVGRSGQRAPDNSRGPTATRRR